MEVIKRLKIMMNLEIAKGQLISCPTHLLVCGTTGSGKSVFLHACILSAISQGYYLAMVDLKRVELSYYETIQNLIKPIAKTENNAYLLIEYIHEKMMARYKAMEHKHLRKSNDTPLMLVIDEYAYLTNKNKKIMQLIESIAMLGRAANVHLILVTQYPIAKHISTTIKNNTCKVCFKCSSQLHYRLVLDHKINKLPMYCGIFQAENGEEKLIKAYNYSDGEITEIVNKFKRKISIFNIFKAIFCAISLPILALFKSDIV